MSIVDQAEDRLCVVNCGLPGDQCACFRSQMAAIYQDLLSRQEPLGAEFLAVWNDNIKELYES